MELYIDMIFMVSWCMDAFLLWTAGRICGFRTKKRRVVAGGFLSALLYCFWVCFFQNKGGFLLSVLLLSIGLLVAYYPKNGRNLLRLFVASWAGSFLLGGGMNVLFTMTQAQRLFGKGLILQKTYPWWLLPWAVGMAYACLKLAGTWLEANIRRRQDFCTINVLFRGRGTECRVLIDTGNGLQKQGRGVAVVQISSLLPLFTKEEQMRFLSGDMRGLDWMAYTSLGNPNGRLWGIQAEKLILSFGERYIIHKNIFVGMNSEDFTGAYEGLVPPSLLEEE